MTRKLLRLLPGVPLLLLGLSSCATQSDRSWIGPDIGRVDAAVYAPVDASPLAEPSGAATR